MQPIDLVLLAALSLSAALHLVQRARARLLERFVAPQVTALVRRRASNCIGETRSIEISAVVCDLRGFTAFCESNPSRRAIHLLAEFYAAVGAAAAEFGGTIKDQAGDGVLILVGAPLPVPDHALRALQIARRIRRNGITLTARWSGERRRVGIGVGVASGQVTAGVIGAGCRLEYAAVGPAVNRAAKLCARAPHGALLLDERCVELLGDHAARSEVCSGHPLHLKGIGMQVPSYELRTRESARLQPAGTAEVKCREDPTAA